MLALYNRCMHVRVSFRRLLKENLLGDLTCSLDRRDTLSGDVAAEASLFGRHVLIDHHLALACGAWSIVIRISDVMNELLF